jgi:hypothetical protein
MVYKQAWSIKNYRYVWDVSGLQVLVAGWIGMLALLWVLLRVFWEWCCLVHHRLIRKMNRGFLRGSSYLCAQYCRPENRAYYVCRCLCVTHCCVLCGKFYLLHSLILTFSFFTFFLFLAASIVDVGHNDILRVPLSLHLLGWLHHRWPLL